MVASLKGVGDHFRKTDGPTGANKISLIGIYTTSSANNIGDRDANDQTVSTGTSVYFGYRRIKDSTGGTAAEEYAQTSPFDVVAGTAPSDTDTTHGGVTTGTQFYRLADWDGYVHWQGSTSPYRERPTAFTLITNDCDQGNNCCGTGTRSKNGISWKNGCNPERIAFSWTLPSQPTDDPEYNDGKWTQRFYLNNCSDQSNPCLGAGDIASSSGYDVLQGIANYTTTTDTIESGLVENRVYTATIITIWDDTGIGGDGYDHHSYPASPSSPTGCYNCGTTGNSITDLYFTVGECINCNDIGTVVFNASFPSGVSDGTSINPTYSTKTLMNSMTTGDCFFDSLAPSGGTVCTTSQCGDLVDPSYNYAINTIADSPPSTGYPNNCDAANPYRVYSINVGCISSAVWACVGA